MNLITRHEHRALIADLLTAPQKIIELQAALDLIEGDFQTMLAHLTLRAYNEPLFPGKKEGEALRIASNDDERKLAVQLLSLRDVEFRRATDYRNEVQRRLTFERNKLESARIVARLIGEPQQ